MRPDSRSWFTPTASSHGNSPHTRLPQLTELAGARNPFGRILKCTGRRQSWGGMRASVKEAFERNVFHDHCEDHDEEDVEEALEDALEDEEDLSEDKGKERVEPKAREEPRVNVEPKESVGDRTSVRGTTRLLGGDSHGPEGRRSAMGRDKPPPPPPPSSLTDFRIGEEGGHKRKNWWVGGWRVQLGPPSESILVT
ncbi:hypothetical protein SK128_009399 [Halocaridina rubra]|uniref:Uncharacterized protein n=1 Tax=Halocaridina rubra TaxID=373956 RepID=A0AAN8ZUP7_HALRR